MTENQVEMILKAGKLTFQYENGTIRYIRLGNYEIIRNIYFSLRDQNWGTIPYRIENFTPNIKNDSFELSFEAIHFINKEDIFSWNVIIKGESDNSIILEINGKALKEFSKNRAGFCILHPIEECASKEVKITEINEQITFHEFPKFISPTSPFPILKGINWKITDGIIADLKLEGDEFETEDHRNWTDSSFKTFCTPLANPFPVMLKKGELVSQKITLNVNFNLPKFKEAFDNQIVNIELLNKTVPLPHLGTLQSFEKKGFTPYEIEQLRHLNLEHYRVEIDLESSDWPNDILKGNHEAKSINTKLLLALTFGEDSLSDLNDFLDFAKKETLVLHSIIIFQKGSYCTPTSLIESLVPKLKSVFSEIKIGAGVQSNYAELGRNIFDSLFIDFIVYGIQPQEHAFDDATLIENIESQAETLSSAMALYPQKEIFVSPLSLKKRINPYAKNVSKRFEEQPLLIQLDNRQGTDFEASWLLGSIKNLAEAGVNAISIFRSNGQLGLLKPNMPAHPSFEILKKLQILKGGIIHNSKSSEKLECSSFFIEKNGLITCFLVNHSNKNISVIIPQRHELIEIEALKIAIVELDTP